MKVEKEILNKQALQKKFDRITFEFQKKLKNINSIIISDDETQRDELLFRENYN